MIEFARHTLLLVDDSPADRFLVRELLLEEDDRQPTLLDAEDLTSATAILNETNVDLVLLDLGLPESTGMETLRLVRAAAPAVPVMILTGQDDEEMALEALREGASDYVVKGGESGRALRRAVRMSLERAQLMRDLERQHQRARDGENRLGVLFEMAQDAIISYDDRGRIIHWNRAAEVLFGYSREEALGHTLALITPDGFLAPEEGAGGSPLRRSGIRQHLGRRKDGSTMPVELSLSKWSEDGRLCTTAILRDVTERDAARDAIEALSRQYEVLLTCAGQGIIGVSADGQITFANPAALALTGRTLEGLVGRFVHEALHHHPDTGGSTPPETCPLHRALTQGAELRSDTRFQHADGSTFPVAVTVRPILNKGRADGSVLVFDDTSARQALEEQLRHAQKMEVVGSLSGGIAHDFNNELAIITLNAGQAIAELEQGGTVGVQGLKEIKAAADRATRITRQLLGFSRRAPMELRPTDLGNTVRQLASILARLLPEGITCRVQAPPEACVSQVDEGMVEQALLNLATNARDAMPEGGELEIAIERVVVGEDAPAESAGSYHAIVVRDTGIGMDKATAEKALMPFFTTKPQGKGTGLGLSMVYGLARQMGGFLRIESQPGQGTSVRLCLPVSEAAVQPKETAAASAAPDGDGALVLLVEDEENLRDTCARILARCGYRVLSAEDGSRALELYEAHRDDIDVVLSDMGMPGLGGRELHDEIVRRYGPIPFVFTTGHADVARIDGHPILIKPWPVDALLEALQAEVARSGPRTGGE